MPMYDKDSPNTSDPRKISNFLAEQGEHLKYLFANIGEENFSEELYLKINSMAEQIDSINERLGALLSTEEK